MHRTTFIAKQHLGSCNLPLHRIIDHSFGTRFSHAKFSLIVSKVFIPISFCRSQPEASIPNHTVAETAISYYKRKRVYRRRAQRVIVLTRGSGDLRKGVDFSDPNLPKMTMTTFDGQPYIEQYTLSKLEIVPDFGTEKKAAPTPVVPH